MEKNGEVQRTITIIIFTDFILRFDGKVSRFSAIMLSLNKSIKKYNQSVES